MIHIFAKAVYRALYVFETSSSKCDLLSKNRPSRVVYQNLVTYRVGCTSNGRSHRKNLRKIARSVVDLMTMLEGQQFCMSKILSYMQFYNGTKAKQTLFAYLRTRTRRHAFASSSTTPTWIRRDVFLYQP